MKLIVVLGAFLLSACVSVQSTSLSNVSRADGQRYTASDSDIGFLEVQTPNIDDITDRVMANFYKKCEKGSLANVQTTLTKRDFLLVQHYGVDVTAICTSR